MQAPQNGMNGVATFSWKIVLCFSSILYNSQNRKETKKLSYLCTFVGG